LGLREATVREFEAGAWHGGGFLKGTVAVRLHDLDGAPLGYAGRILDPERVSRDRKWNWPPRYPKSQLLYNWHRAQSHRASGLIVVEGFWSVMKLAQAGYRNVVALGGAAVTNRHAALLATAAQVILMLDGDVAGVTASDQLIARRVHPRLQAVRLPEGQDPADLPEGMLVRILTPIIRAPL
jgi:DNA primase